MHYDYMSMYIQYILLFLANGLITNPEAPNSGTFVMLVDSQPPLLSTHLGVYQRVSKHTLTLMHVCVLPALVSKLDSNS